MKVGDANHQNKRFLIKGFLKPLILFTTVAIVLNRTTYGALTKNPAQGWQTTAKSIFKNDNETSTDNSTFSITFKKGDHYPTINFPFGEAGSLIFPAVITAYLFLCLTIVCDCFLVPCVQGISTRLEWSLDITAVTLLAAASSSPEMFVNILATFLTNSDVGVGTVLGTGLFALLLVPALCILLTSSKVLKVDFWPILRESLAYMTAVIALLCVLADQKVVWYEALALITLYCIYVIVLCFNDELKYKFDSFVAAIRKKKTMGSLMEPLLPKPGRLKVSMSVEDVFYVLEDHTPEPYTMVKWPVNLSILAKIEWILMWPIVTIFRMTIPTFWNSRFPQLYVITFAMCVAWIGVLCYCISWMITTLGNKISMPESVMGLTLLAAGMSIPETISGVIVANQGYGTMAMCNAFGSNTFAILICLGVPWLMKIILFQKPGQDFIVINSEGIEYSVCIVLAAIIVVFFIFLTNKFRLKVKVGWFLVLLYLSFVGVSVYVELQFFWWQE